MAAADTTTTVRRPLRPVPQIAAHRRRARAEGLGLLGDHDRSQADRDHVPGHDVRLLPDGRGRGAADAPAAGRRRTTRCSRPQTYNALFTMHGTTMVFLFVVPIMAGLRQLLRAADDRRARHGVPEAQRAVVLALARRRHRLLRLAVLVSPPECGWTCVHAALDGRLLAHRRRRRVDLPRPPHRHLARSSARSTSTRRSRTCARPAWAGAACRCSSGRSSSTRSC